MPSFAKIMMDKADELRRDALDRDEISLSFGYDAFENMINNVHHGKSPAEWVPQIVQIYSDLSIFEEDEAKAITEMISLTYEIADKYNISIPRENG